jgi:hypothetical protein
VDATASTSGGIKFLDRSAMTPLLPGTRGLVDASAEPSTCGGGTCSDLVGWYDSGGPGYGCDW